MSVWEIVGSGLGIIGVWLMIRQNVWGWPVGLVQVAAYAWVFFDAKLYSDAILQVCFLVIQGYGWWHWWRGDRGDGSAERCALPVTRLPGAALAGWIVGGALLSAAWGELMHRTTDAALPHWDAFILVFSLIAQWLQARKILENWVGWAIVNTVAIGVYWAKDLRLTSGLYLGFWLMAGWGWREWRISMQGRGACPQAPSAGR